MRPVKFIVLLIIFFGAISCGSKKNIPQSTPEEKGIRIETLLPIQKPSLTIRHSPTMGQSAFRPFRQVVSDSASKTTLTLSVDETGSIQADCQQAPDTVRLVQYIRIPESVESPCPEPEKKKTKSKSHFLWYVLMALIGYNIGKIVDCLKPKKTYDRLKAFISAKFRRK